MPIVSRLPWLTAVSLSLALTACITDPSDPVDDTGGSTDGGGPRLDGAAGPDAGGPGRDGAVPRGDGAVPTGDAAVPRRDGAVPRRDGDVTGPDTGGPRTDADVDGGVVGDAAPPVGREPRRHRPTVVGCDDERSNEGPFIDDETLARGGDELQCTAHEDCTDGDNGRCVGNSHDGWYCTYDLCASDDGCDGGVCECGGGWRSDHNVCLGGNCRVDADCGPGGYCSPTFGDCGDYSGVEAYQCHTPDDACIDDEDCGDGAPFAAYCAFNPAARRWMCSDSQCAG